MELQHVVALLLCCYFAAVESRHNGDLAKPGSLLKPGYKIITEPAKPEPGFYLNRQFQKKNTDDAKNPVQTQGSARAPTLNIAQEFQYEDGYFLNRHFQDPVTDNKEQDVVTNVHRVVDAQGRYWVVSEQPQPEPGFYLNRHFQKEKTAKESVPKKAREENQLFLVRNNPDNNKKEIIPVADQESTPMVSAPSVNTQPKPVQLLDFFTVIPAQVGLQAFPFVPSQTQHSQQPVRTQSMVAVPSVTVGSGSPPFIVKQMLSNIEQSKVFSPATATTKVGNLNVHQPQVQLPAQQSSDRQSSTGFSCEGKPYGYYADLESNCQQYHICNPITFSSGRIRNYQYSFTCGTGLRWDQEKKVCAPSGVASPCQ